MRMLLVLAAVAQVTVIPRATAPAKDYPIQAPTNYPWDGKVTIHVDPA